MPCPPARTLPPNRRADRMLRVKTRVTIEAEKKRYFIGEEIYINHVLENVGKVSFEHSSGGDYRGATRHLGFYIEAIHQDGTKMPDPDPNQICFGGLMTTQTMAPGQKHTDRLELLAYRRLDRPGKYIISAGQDLVPATIELVAPSLEQANGLVDEIEAKNKPRDKNNNNDDPQEITEYRRLTHPAYLPRMVKRAGRAPDSALLALGQTPDPAATKVIIELLDSSDPKFVNKVQEALYLRMPDPLLDNKLHKRNFFDMENVEARTYLRDQSWRPEFAADVRKHVRKVPRQKR